MILGVRRATWEGFSEEVAGIDLASAIAGVAAAIDIGSIFSPWVIGVSIDIVQGRFVYTPVADFTALDLMGSYSYLSLLFFAVLCGIAAILLRTAHLSVFTRFTVPKYLAWVLLGLGIVLSEIPASMFTLDYQAGRVRVERAGAFIAMTTVGSGFALPPYAALAFGLSLVIRILKDSL